MATHTQLVNRSVVLKVAGVFLFVVILWISYEAYNVVSSMNRRRAIIEYYMAINDSLLAIRSFTPPLNKDSAQLDLENRLQAQADRLHRKYRLLTNVRITTWGTSNVVFEVRWAGKDGKLGTQDDETKQWDLDESHPGMSAKQLNALRAKESSEGGTSK
jgi:hypothetical protein